MLTPQRLRELFDYRQDTGELIRKVAISKSSKVGEVVGFFGHNDYRYASVDNRTYPLHRLVWKWHGFDDVEILDHINCNPMDNRIENLRPATKAQNMQNRGIAKNNTSGAKGVSWHKRKCKFQVRVGVNGKRIRIGYFDDFELAELVAIEAREKYHGKFANH